MLLIRSALWRSDARLSLFFLYKFIHFNWRLITLQYCSGFCHALTWIRHGCTCVPHPEPHLPPHPIPQGHPSAPALRTPSHASNLDCQPISHMIIYMFQCHSPKSSRLSSKDGILLSLCWGILCQSLLSWRSNFRSQKIHTMEALRVSFPP